MANTSLQIGAVIGGKYRLESLLGRGGMGSVYVAEHTMTGKRVAIKSMHRDVAQSPEAAQRFLREARASARIRHPNVVDVYDILSQDGMFFLVMELLEGEPLASLMIRKTTLLPQFIRLLIGAMRGVSAAHRQGVIHRDIKPENIFLAREGDASDPVPKVLDFGISKIQDTHDISLTAPGATLGTIMYMSTEQLSGAANIDGRADVYALGVILYEAITGRSPFDGETYSALIFRIMTEAPIPVKQLRPETPRALSKLIESAMAKKREERPANIDAFIAELEPFANEPSFRDQSTRPISRPLRVRPPDDGSPPSLTLESAPSDVRKAAAELQNASIETPFVASRESPRIPAAPSLALALMLLVVVAGGVWFWHGTRTSVTETSVRAVSAPEATVWTPPAPTAPPPSAAVQINPPPSAAAQLGAAPAATPPVAFPAARPIAATPSTSDKADVKHSPSSAPEASTSSDAAHRAVATIPAGHHPNPTPAPIPNVPTSASPRADSCKPNYFLDAQGDKHFKPECF